MNKHVADDLHDEIKVGRLQVFARLKKSIARNYLLKLSRHYVANGAKQMVIFSFDHIGHSINLHGCYEHDGLNLIAHWLERNDLIRGNAIDVGANIGNHSLFFSRYYRTVFAFEPNPRSYEVLRLNSRLADNMLIFNFGLSDKVQSVTLAQDTVNVGNSEIAPRLAPLRGSQVRFDIKLRPLDEVTELGQSEIGLLKIDVEGHELQALRGAERTLRRHMPIILFEQHAAEIHDGTSYVIEYLKSLNYGRFAILRERPGLPSWVPAILRIPMLNLARLLLGTTHSINEIDRFDVAFYSLIVAMPGKLELS